MKHRLVRVAEILKRELSTVILREVPSDGALITVNAVDVSPDLRNATVHVGVLGTAAHTDSPSADDSKKDPYADKFDNLHLVNPNDVDGRFLAAFARDVLQVPANSKSAIADLLKKEFGIDVAVARETSNSMIRMALAECVKQAQAEAEQLKNMQ